MFIYVKETKDWPDKERLYSSDQSYQKTEECKELNEIE